MNIKEHEKLTNGQTIGLLIGFTLGPEFLKLPNLLVPRARQDSWISAIFALIYPVLIVLIANTIIKKFPEDNLMKINKRIFGNILGKILSVVFLLQFIVYTGSILSEFARIARIFIVAFLTPTKVAVVTYFAALYIATLGIKTCAKVSELITYFIAFIILLTVFIFKEGSFINLTPVFENGLPNILNASIKTAYFFGGLEAMLIIHPHIKDIKSVRKTSMMALTFCCVVWVWAVFSTIVYLGIDMIPKSLWSFFMVYDAVNFPIINNVRYVFMFTWSLVSLRIVSNYICISRIMIKDVVKLKSSIIYLALTASIISVALIFANDLFRQRVLSIMSPAYVVYNLVLFSLIAVISLFKKNKEGGINSGRKN